MSEIKQVSEINHLVHELSSRKGNTIEDLERVVKSFAAGPNLYLRIWWHESDCYLRAYHNQWELFLTKLDNVYKVWINTSDDTLFHDIGLITAIYADNDHLENNQYYIRTLLYAWTGSNDRVDEIMKYSMSDRGCIIRVQSNNIPDISIEEKFENYLKSKSDHDEESMEEALGRKW